MTTQKTISVTYHNLPTHLRKEAVARAKDCGHSFRNVLMGCAEFVITCPADPYQTPRQLVGIVDCRVLGEVFPINPHRS